MKRSIWVTLFTILGLLALSALIWFVGPWAGYGETWPLEGVMTRIIIIAVIWSIWLLIVVIGWLRRRAQARALEAEMAAASDDTPILKEKMEDAMATLRRTSSRGGTAFLYDLPWYIIIGPPGSGKTTALVNSGLKFPLAESGQAQAVAGVGGTRHCDWWFTEESVMIDTAGRYTTQDSDAEADSKSWEGFLDMLAENRPRQPINGVLVCISIEDIMRTSQQELDGHANAIRRRLDELHNRLKIAFPVYVMFTKMDLVAGFMEFFSDLTPDQRSIVWGATFKPKNKTDNMVSTFGDEFDELMGALAKQTTDRLQMEPDSRARSRVFGFPSQMASLQNPITQFLTAVFEPSRYQSEAALRGVYFTSGTQEGTPIDRVLGALSRNFGAHGAAAPMLSGQGKSFFLTNLLQQVVFAEQGWVSTNVRHIRRKFAVKSALYTLLLLGVVGVGGLWGYSYMRNSQLQEQNENAISEYRELAARRLAETEVKDGNLHEVLEPLDKLRNMPLGYSTRDQEVPLMETFGLSQHERIRRANITAYRDALDRMYLPRLIWRLEDQLSKNINDVPFVFRGLRVYMMLGGQSRMDEDLVRTWMERDWSALYPGAANAAGRTRLFEHLDTILERPSSSVALNGPLVQEAQRTLARMPVADRAYALMKATAEATDYPDWVASERAGPDASVVFTTRNGDSLSDVRINGFFTYEGFHLGVLAQMEDVVENARSERKVLGEVGDQTAIEEQFKTIRKDIMNRYRTDFIQQWDQQLSRLKIAPVTGDGNHKVMSALAAPTSPLKQMMISIRDETQLTKLPEGAGAAAAGGAAGERAAQNELERAAMRRGTSAAGRIGTAVALGTLSDVAAGDGEVAINYGEEIEAHFKNLHEFAGTAEGGAAPVDTLVARFNTLYQALSLMGAGGEARIQGLQQMNTTLQVMKSEAPRLPGLVANMTNATRGALEDVVLGGSKTQLAQALGNEVSRACQEVLRGRYPFSAGSAKDVSIDDFTRLFGPQGIMSNFFQQKLSGMVDQSGRVWKWKGDTRLSRNLSQKTLREFQRAAEIREAFFASGAAGVSFTVTPVTLSPDAYTVVFDIDGQKLEYDHRRALPQPMRWPGPAAGRVEIAVTPEIPGQQSRTSQNGIWALFRLIRKGRPLAGPDGLSVTFDIGGRQAIFSINTVSVRNPFNLPALTEFQCPLGL